MQVRSLKRLLSRLRRAGSVPPTLSSVDAYARWAAAYPARAHNALMQCEQDALLELLPPLAGATVLDLACGTGRYGLLAGERGARRVIALDNSLPMLTAAELPLRALASVEQIPLADQSVDGVICALALGHLTSLDRALAEIGRTLKQGGWALISDFHPLLYSRGARRTFSVEGRQYAVEHYPHRHADYARAAGSAGLTMEDVREPALAPELIAQGAAAGPVVMVCRLRRAE